MLQKPAKIVCAGQKVKFSMTAHDPFKWIATEQKLITFALDGYIVDTNKQITAIFQKLEYTQNEYRFELKDLFELYSPKLIKSILRLSESLQADYKLLIWSKNYVPENHYLTNQKDIQIVSLALKNDEISLENIEFIGLKDLENLISRYRKRSFEAVKPLLTGTSCVGCFLSNHTKNPFPGDADALIYNPLTHRVGRIIEFKTHNINTLTENESIGKYGKQDWRRFEVLYNLQAALAEKTAFEPKIWYVAWGTGDYENHRNIKIDEIKNNQIVRTHILKRPEFGVFSRELFDLLVNQ
jgi:hypothetical protein